MRSCPSFLHSPRFPPPFSLVPAVFVVAILGGAAPRLYVLSVVLLPPPSILLPFLMQPVRMHGSGQGEESGLLGPVKELG